MHRIQNFLARCTDNELQKFLAAASKAALAAGRLILERYERPHDIAMKGAIDLVTEADLASEASIVASLALDCPGTMIMTEEDTQTHEVSSNSFWVVDPLDGTTNFAHGFPFFAVSIALLDHGKPLIGVVYAPLLDELFFAVRGSGAWLNGRAISVSDTVRLIEALIGTGFPYDIDQALPEIIRQLKSILPKVRDIRRAGAAALDLAYVSCGRLDGFYERNLKPWDTAAGWLLVEEAGGVVTDFSGNPHSPRSPGIIASNGALHQQLLNLVQ